MSVVATALVLGLVIAGLVRTRWLRPSGAVVCIVFGMVLGGTPVGPTLNDGLNDFGGWAYGQLRSV